MESLIEKNTQLKVQPDDYIEEYLEFLKDYKIKYRDKLGVPKDYTFGIEIEYEDYPESEFAKIIEDRYKNVFNSKTELDMINGGEVTSKVMTDRISTWKNISYILKELKRVGSVSKSNCGSHVHVGAHVLGNDIKKWKRFLYLYAVYEHIIYRFASGEFINQRELINAKAYPIAIDLANLVEEIESAESLPYLGEVLMSDDRYRGLNLINVIFSQPNELKDKNTVEFRMANGTHEPVIWQNLVNFYLKLIQTSTTDDIDLEYLKYRLEKLKEKGYYSGYNKIWLQDAFELSDIVFNNDLDKANFMKQYIKDGGISDSIELIKSKKFIQ